MTCSLGSRIESANLALFVEKNLNAVNEYFTPDYVAHLTHNDMTGGHRAVQEVLRTYYRAFDDILIEVDILLEARDRVAWQRTVTATHKNSLKGFSGTGRTIVWRDMVTSCFCRELIAEEWIVSDLAEQLLLSRKRPRSGL